MKNWERLYLHEVTADPDATLEELAGRLQVPLDTLTVLRRENPEVRAEEERIRLKHQALQRLRATDVQVIEDVPYSLQRFAELYESLGSRKACFDQLRIEGYQLKWSDVLKATEEYPAFRKRLEEAACEVTAAIEDVNTAKALEGSMPAIQMHLRANNPGKYAPSLRVAVTHRHQLATEDRDLINLIKERHIAQLPAAPPQTLGQRLKEAGVEDAQEILDAEYVQ